MYIYRILPYHNCKFILNRFQTFLIKVKLLQVKDVLKTN